MFSKLMGRVFGKGKDKPEAAIEEEAAPTPAPEPAAVEETAEEAAPEAATPEAAAEAAPAAPAPIDVVDVEANLTAMAKANPEKLDWKKSIVDLLKLVGMDSSYGARKELALELGYSAEDIEKKGSAEMNIWLHKQVMKKLAENGGTVPAELLD